MLILKTIFFLIIMPGTVLLYVPLKIVESSINIEFQLNFIRYSAFLFWGTGSYVSLWCVRDFISKGKGTPAPIDPPKKLVIKGFYKYIRNPMYVGILIILTGHIVWFKSISLIVYFLVLFGFFHLFVIHYEEPYLLKTFGEAYKNYKSQVPRWFPRIPSNG